MTELLVTVVIWGLSFPLAKKSLRVFTPFELVTFRLFLGALGSWLLSRFVRLKPAGDAAAESGGGAWKAALALGAFEFSGTYIFYTWSLQFLPSGVVGTLTLMTPIFTFLIGLPLGVYGFSLRALGAVLLAFAGAVLCSPTTLTHLKFEGPEILGVALIMASNVLFASGNVLITRLHLAGRWSAGMTVRGLWIGAFLSLIVTVFSTSKGLGVLGGGAVLNGPALAVPLYLGLVATGCGFFLWNRGVQKVSAVPASVVGNLKAPLAVIWAFVLLGETVSHKFLLGLVLLLISVQMIPRPARRDANIST